MKGQRENNMMGFGKKKRLVDILMWLWEIYHRVVTWMRIMDSETQPFSIIISLCQG